MKNKANSISIFHITGKLTNPNNNYEMSECLIPIIYGTVTRAWFGYSDIQIGKAGGGGYDKESTALAEAIVKLTGDKDLYDMGSGWQSVARRAEKKGYKVEKIW